MKIEQNGRQTSIVMKKLSIIVLFTMIQLTAFAYDAQIDGLWYNLNTNKKTAEVTYKDYYNRCYNTNWKYLNVTIPTTVTYNEIKYTVTSIGDNAFNSCSILKSVQLPNTIKSIGKSAFEGCWELDNVIIPDSVSAIGDAAFQNCNTFNSIDIPSSVTQMGEYVFYGCDHLTSVQINGNITEIKAYSFALCNRLLSIAIPNTVESIGSYAFRYCSLLTSIEIPSSVTSIMYDAFADCSQLTTVAINSNAVLEDVLLKSLFGEQVSIYIIGKDVTNVGHGTFFYCNNLKEINVDPNNHNYCSSNGVLYNKDMTEIIQYPIGKEDTTFIIPNGITCIIGGAFRDCKNIKSITLSKTIVYIEEESFYNCGSLESVEIPNNVISIGYASFYKCKSLSVLSIGDHVSSIGGFAFGECKNLVSISCKAIDVPELSYEVFYTVDKSTCTLYVPAESIELYKSASEWKDFNPILPIASNEAIDEIISDNSISSKSQNKIVKDGNILILRGDQTYTITGAEVK